MTLAGSVSYSLVLPSPYAVSTLGAVSIRCPGLINTRKYWMITSRTLTQNLKHPNWLFPVTLILWFLSGRCLGDWGDGTTGTHLITKWALDARLLLHKICVNRFFCTESFSNSQVKHFTNTVSIWVDQKMGLEHFFGPPPTPGANLARMPSDEYMASH